MVRPSRSLSEPSSFSTESGRWRGWTWKGPSSSSPGMRSRWRDVRPSCPFRKFCDHSIGLNQLARFLFPTLEAGYHGHQADDAKRFYIAKNCLAVLSSSAFLVQNLLNPDEVARDPVYLVNSRDHDPGITTPARNPVVTEGSCGANSTMLVAFSSYLLSPTALDGHRGVRTKKRPSSAILHTHVAKVTLQP